MTKILIIDDNEDLSQVLGNILQIEGYETSLQYSGFKAIEHLRQDNHYDLIITDMLMADGDGVDVLEYLGSENIKTPTLVLSGGGATVGSKETLAVASEMATATMGKPIQFDVMLKKIADILKCADDSPLAG